MAIPPRRYSDIRNREVSLPLHSERIRKAIIRSDPGFLSPVLSGTPIPSFFHPLTISNTPCTIPIIVNQKVRVYWSRISKIQQWRKNPSLTIYSALSRARNPNWRWRTKRQPWKNPNCGKSETSVPPDFPDLDPQFTLTKFSVRVLFIIVKNSLSPIYLILSCLQLI